MQTRYGWMSTRCIRALALSLVWAVSGAAQAASVCTARSPAHRVALVELYSSEGCSSCPPADHWLSQWKDGGTASGVVPLALHVDYWNSLGWTDRFSRHSFTERQQGLAERAGGHLVYTPEVFVSGRELRNWSHAASFDARVAQVRSEPAAADITITLEPAGADSASSVMGVMGAAASTQPMHVVVDAQFTAHGARERGPLEAYVAVYENALTTQVRAGENSGATLHHDRVVRQWIGPVVLDAGHAHIEREIALPADAQDALKASRGSFGVVAFVENAASGDVLQAADLPACH